jgi:hypothetical protein
MEDSPVGKTPSSFLAGFWTTKEAAHPHISSRRGQLHAQHSSLADLPAKLKRACADTITKGCMRSLADLILVAFITGNSSLEPLIEGLYAQIHVNLR